MINQDRQSNVIQFPGTQADPSLLARVQADKPIFRQQLNEYSLSLRELASRVWVLTHRRIRFDSLENLIHDLTLYNLSSIVLDKEYIK